MGGGGFGFKSVREEKEDAKSGASKKLCIMYHAICTRTDRFLMQKFRQADHTGEERQTPISRPPPFTSTQVQRISNTQLSNTLATLCPALNLHLKLFNMLSHIIKKVFARAPSHPSAVLLVHQGSRTIRHSVLHIVPEDGGKETMGYTTLRSTDCKELSREQLGTIMVGDNGSAYWFVDEINVKARRLLDLGAETTEFSSHDVEQALRSAALDSLRNMKAPLDKAHACSVFVVRIDRPKPGRILDGYNPRTLVRWF